MSVEDDLCETLGFRVKNNQIQTAELRENTLGKKVPKGVRPATNHEIKMWNALINGW